MLPFPREHTMPSAHPVRPIDPRWIESVLELIEDGSSEVVRWSSKAARDWNTAAPQKSRDDGLLWIRKVLEGPNPLGRPVVAMRDLQDRTYLDTWEFLAPHPLGTPISLYIKIGLNHGQLRIWLISLHIDETGDLERAIAEYQKQNST